MRALKITLAVNGLVFFVRALANLCRPTSFYLDPGASRNTIDTVHVLGITYGAVGLIQVGAWRVADRGAVRLVARASQLFAAAVAVKAWTQDSGPPDAFHRLRIASAAENAAVAVLYAVLLDRERRSAL